MKQQTCKVVLLAKHTLPRHAPGAKLGNGATACLLQDCSIAPHWEESAARMFAAAVTAAEHSCSSAAPLSSLTHDGWLQLQVALVGGDDGTPAGNLAAGLRGIW